MQADYIIIGQGICGTFLSWNLLKERKTVLVIDNANPITSSRVASGVINPVTGRRVVTTWMIEALLPFAWQVYNEIGNELGEKIIEQKSTITFPPSYQMKETYEKRITEPGSYIQNASSQKDYQEWFHFIFDSYVIDPTYFINLHPLLNGWKKKLLDNESILNEEFKADHLILTNDHVQYKNITARKIIFCDGVNSFQNRYWQNLPYVYNKGQALIADIPGLQHTNIYKFGALTFVPWYNDLWWIGSSYENEFETTAPTKQFYDYAVQQLSNILKISFTIKDHLAAVRPATIERRPFVGLHPQYSSIAIFNGMGTKGCSLAPWFAKQFSDHLIHAIPLDPLSDIKRFHRILTTQ